MSDTPRTDAKEFEAEVHDSVMRRFPVFVVNVNFARELERALNARVLNAVQGQRSAVIQRVIDADAARYKWLVTNNRWRASWWQRFTTVVELNAAIDKHIMGEPRSGDVVSGETNA